MFLGLTLIVASIVLLVLLLQYWYQTGYFRPEGKNFHAEKQPKKRPKSYSDYEDQALSLVEDGGLTSHEKGLNFEKFVTTLLTKKYGFQLKEWRGDKYHNGVYAISTQYPDLEYRYESNNFHINFAIECKWRNGFWNGTVQLGNEIQLKNYKAFAEERRISVYIFLGIGGHPTKPAELFVIPIHQVPGIKITRTEILKWKRKNVNYPIMINRNNSQLF